MHDKPTITAWQREEDGSYKAEIEGAELEVRWQRESADGTRGFRYRLERGGKRVEHEELFEEMELAMVAAEAAARQGAGPSGGSADQA